MAKAKANKSGFIELTVPAKITYSRDRVIDMTGNPNFTTPNPTLATVTTVTNDLETAELAAEGGGTAQTAARDAAELIWDNTLRMLADYVDLIAQGNVVIITSAGFTPTSTERQPAHVPEKPENLKMKHSDNSGEILFSCDVVANAENYVAVLSTDAVALDIPTRKTQLMIDLKPESASPSPLAAPPPPSASPARILLVIDVSSQRKKVITGLSTGTRIHGKIYCTNSAGRGPDSDAISIMVG